MLILFLLCISIVSLLYRLYLALYRLYTAYEVCGLCICFILSCIVCMVTYCYKASYIVWGRGVAMEDYCVQDEEESLLSVSCLRSVLSVLILLSSIGLLTGIVTGNSDFVFGFGGLSVLSFALDFTLWFCD